MNEKVKLGAFYETRCGLIAEVRAIDHETSRIANQPVIVTVLHPAGSEDPDPLDGQKYEFDGKENFPVTITGEDNPGGKESPYDLMREVDKPAGWDNIPNPDFT